MHWVYPFQQTLISESYKMLKEDELIFLPAGAAGYISSYNNT